MASPSRVVHIDALAESLDATELLFRPVDVDEPDLAIAVAGGDVDVGDLELEVGVAGLRDDVLDKPGGNALASGPLGDGDELDVARAVRVVEVRCPLWSKNSCGKCAAHEAKVAAPVSGAHPHGTAGAVRACDCPDDVAAAIRDEKSAH